MARSELRVRVDASGNIELIDPDPEVLQALRDFGIGAASADVREPAALTRHLRRAKRFWVEAAVEDLESLPANELWQLHGNAMRSFSSGGEGFSDSGGATLLDLKIELARRALQNCGLCWKLCGVNRFKGQIGECGLPEAAFVGDYFVHAAEEDPIRPSCVINLKGCGLRCVYCQQYRLLTVNALRSRSLESTLWSDLDFSAARTFSFVGGNPDESLFAVLRFLRVAPDDFDLPIVWNCHGYGTPVVYALLDGIVDCYVMDFKYGNSRCGLRWSGVDAYPRRAETTLRKIVKQDVLVIVRVLILPGHLQCCHVPTLSILKPYKERILLHVLDQYSPDYRIRASDGAMAGKADFTDVLRHRASAEALGFHTVSASQNWSRFTEGCA